MAKRRWFADEFKVRLALEALRGDRAAQGEADKANMDRARFCPPNASKHKVHPNQVSTWKRQAIDGLADVFSKGSG